jgi:predicted DNA-binding transcriptional regulator YafY
MTGHREAMIVTIRYTNYRGETTDRRIIPKAIRFASTEWHPEEQWLLDAFDLDRGSDRSFALRDIHSWR